MSSSSSASRRSAPDSGAAVVGTPNDENHWATCNQVEAFQYDNQVQDSIRQGTDEVNRLKHCQESVRSGLYEALHQLAVYHDLPQRHDEQGYHPQSHEQGSQSMTRARSGCCAYTHRALDGGDGRLLGIPADCRGHGEASCKVPRPPYALHALDAKVSQLLAPLHVAHTLLQSCPGLQADKWLGWANLLDIEASEAVSRRS